MSDASGTLWLNVLNRTWSNKLLACSYLEEKHMPKLVEGNENTGYLKKSLVQKSFIQGTVLIMKPEP